MAGSKNMKKLYITICIIVSLISLLTGACTTPAPQPSPSPSPAPAPVPTPTPTPTPAPSGQLTAGQLAEQGKAVLAQYAGACHGPDGEGGRAPAITGSRAQLAKYNNAGQLLNYIRTTMPPNSPGSLSPDQYLQVLCYLLVQNQFVTPQTAINPNQLESLQLKQ
jgi:mono/diheme cytochrome c family protein